jgi:hypothetical protein
MASIEEILVGWGAAKWPATKSVEFFAMYLKQNANFLRSRTKNFLDNA